MEQILDRIVRRYEQDEVSRRESLGALMAVLLKRGALPEEMTRKAVELNHVTRAEPFDSCPCCVPSD